MYMIDRHHCVLAAWLSTNVLLKEKKVFCEVKEDMSSLSVDVFWARMVRLRGVMQACPWCHLSVIHEFLSFFWHPIFVALLQHVTDFSELGVLAATRSRSLGPTVTANTREGIRGRLI